MDQFQHKADPRHQQTKPFSLHKGSAISPRKVLEPLANGSWTIYNRAEPRKLRWPFAIGFVFSTPSNAQGWLRFFTSTEREKFTPSHPKNHEYFPLPGTYSYR
jgi:hypothetical protein